MTISEIQETGVEELSAMAKLAEAFVPVAARFIVTSVIAIAVYFIGARIIRWLSGLLRKLLNTQGVESTAAGYIVSGAIVAARTVLILVIVGQLGLRQGTLIAAIGSMGVGIGLALQGAAANLAGGILILIHRPFKAGDYIVESNEGNEGFIREIGLLYTTLLSVGGRTITIPNQKLTDSSVINMTASGLWILDIVVGIGYSDSIPKAKEIMLDVVKSDPAVLQDQEIMCMVTSLGAHSVDISVRAYTAITDHFQTDWRLRENIKLALDEAGISIAFNQLDVHLDAPLSNLVAGNAR